MVKRKQAEMVKEMENVVLQVSCLGFFKVEFHNAAFSAEDVTKEALNRLLA